MSLFGQLAPGKRNGSGSCAHAQAIRGALEEIVPEAAVAVRILYGGSVNASNAEELFAILRYREYSLAEHHWTQTICCHHTSAE